MLLHKTEQTSPSKVRRPMRLLASEGPVGSYGRLGKAVYVRGARGGLIRMPEVLSGTLGLLEKKARRKRALRGLVIAGLVTLALVVLVWKLGR